MSNVDSDTELRNTINQLKLNTKKSLIMKHIKRFVNRTNKPYSEADESIASSLEENLDRIKTIQPSRSLPILTPKSLKDHEQQENQQQLNESSLSQNSNNSKILVVDNMSTTSGKENTDDDAELIMSQSRTFLRKSKRQVPSQSQSQLISPSSTKTITKKHETQKTSPLVVPVRREKKYHKRLLTGKKLHKSLSECELRRSTRVRTQSNTNLKPVYVCESIQGVNGQKTCVRRIERFERVNNDLMKFRENLFLKMFRKHDTKPNRTKTAAKSPNKKLNATPRTSPVLKKILSTSTSAQTSITTVTATTSTEQTVITDVGIQTSSEDGLNDAEKADIRTNDMDVQTTNELNVVNGHENDEDELDFANEECNKTNEIIDIYDSDIVANIPKGIIRFKSECDSKEFQEISEGIYATVTGLTEGILKLDASKSNHTNEHDTEIIYYVQRGHVTVKISNTINLLTVGDSITIPKFNKYEIANPSKTQPAFMLFRFDKV